MARHGVMRRTGYGKRLLTPAQALVRTRTGDPFLTMEVLYQLSYEGRATEPSAPG